MTMAVESIKRQKIDLDESFFRLSHIVEYGKIVERIRIINELKENCQKRA
jgi:hypothetical protein